MNFTHMPTHWLDEVFESPKSPRDTLLDHERFTQALESALSAHRDATREQKNKPADWAGPSPAQQARLAFLEELNRG
jgi:hypothetical protein